MANVIKSIKFNSNSSENICICGLKEDIVILNWKLSLVLQTLLVILQNSLKLFITNFARHLLLFSLLFRNTNLGFLFLVIKSEGIQTFFKHVSKKEFQ